MYKISHEFKRIKIRFFKNFYVIISQCNVAISFEISKKNRQIM